jgi:hypothetical protein
MTVWGNWGRWRGTYDSSSEQEKGSERIKPEHDYALECVNEASCDSDDGYDKRCSAAESSIGVD